MVRESTTDLSAQRYSATTFVAALGNTLVVSLATWYFLPWFGLAVFVLPVLLLDLAVGAVLVTRSGTISQAGRGMLIALIAAPITLLVFFPGFLLMQMLGLV